MSKATYREPEGPIPLHPGEAAVRESHMYSDPGIIPVQGAPAPGMYPPGAPTPSPDGYGYYDSPQDKAESPYVAAQQGIQPSYGHANEPNGYNPAVDHQGKARKRKRWIWIGLAILLLVIIGAVVGGVVGSKAGKKDKNSDPDNSNSSISTANSNSSDAKTDESTELPQRMGILAAWQSGPAGGSGIWYSDDKQLIYSAGFDGKTIKGSTVIHNTANSESLSEDAKRLLPKASTPLGFCTLSGQGTALLYVNMNGVIDARWRGTNSSTWNVIEKVGNPIIASGDTQLATFTQYYSSGPRTCVVVFQENVGTSLSMVFITANLSQPLSPKLVIGEKKSLPLVNSNDKDYEPLRATSLISMPLWQAYGDAPDYNGAMVVYYQTQTGKIVGSAFDPSSPDTTPPLIRSEELGTALLRTPLALTAEPVTKSSTGYMKQGNYTIYALSKPNVICTWHLDNASLRSRGTAPVIWKSGPDMKKYKGGAIAALVGDGSMTTMFYVATEGMKSLAQFKQSTPVGSERGWTEG